MDRRINIKPINALLKVQLIVLLLTILVFLGVQGLDKAFASAFGGLIAVGNTLLQKWHLILSVKIAGADAGRNLSTAYRCMITRWVFTFIMFAVGFSVLNLAALPLLITFVVIQSAVVFIK